MNMIEFESGKYTRFVKDDSFRTAMARRYRQYLLGYRHNGEVAFDDFLVIDDKGNLKGIYWSSSDPVENLYGIGVRFPLKIMPKRVTDGMLCFNGKAWPAFLVTINDMGGNVLDVATNIFEEDPIWGGLGICTIDDFIDRYATDKEVARLSVLTMLIFAKVQSEALKARKEIVRVSQSTREHGEAKNRGDTRKETRHARPRKIYLCSGIRYTTIPAPSEETREFIRRCEAWHVRGHYRHLKNGKVVYVRPHMKGTGRAKDSMYKLEG